jgi:hypothetical protein
MSKVASSTQPRRRVNNNKPTLIKVGDHYVSIDNVAGFKQAKKGLYILQLKSAPEAEYPLWVSEKEMEAALPYFNIVGV